ncbi:MAG TPA: methyl-accepting chemotaxis protein [Marinagarivorans sp.]
MTVTQRLLAGFGVLIFLMFIITLLGVLRVDTIDRMLTDVNDRYSAKQRAAINFRGSVHDRAIALRDIVLVTDSDQLIPLHEEVQQLTDFYDEARTSLARLREQEVFTPKEVSLLDAINAAESRALAATQAVLKLRNSENIGASQQRLLADAAPAYSTWLRTVNAYIDHQEANIRTDVATVRSIAEGFSMTMLLALLAAVVAGGLMAWMIIGYIRTLLGAEPYKVADAMRQMAAGNLQLEEHKAASNSVMDSSQQLARQLKHVLQEVQITAESVLASSDKMGEMADQNSALINRQNDETQQIAGAVGQMSQSVNEVAEHAQAAAEAAHKADAEVVNGRRVVEENARMMDELAERLESAMTTVQRLSEQSSNIENIISVINAVAEQTNLLALNAAIEAARAGEHGRGFAVVADEVRGLAQRTQSSIREITETIETLQSDADATVTVMTESQQRARTTVEQTQETQRALDQIRIEVGEITQMNQRIAEAVTEQTQVAQEVSRNITGISDSMHGVAQSARGNAEQSSAMKAMAAKLLEQIRYFRVSP